MTDQAFTVLLKLDNTVVEEAEVRAEGARAGLPEDLTLGQLVGELAHQRSPSFREVAVIPGTRVPGPMYQTPGSVGWGRHSTGRPDDPEVTG